MSKKDFWDGYVPEPIYTFKTTSEPIIAAFDMKPNHNISFHNQDGKQVGTLDFNGPEMVFTGDADESAKVFFDFIANAFKARLDQERADEREAVAKWLEDEKDAPYWAELVRARGNT